MPVSLDSPARTPPSVLLIEEYTALAAALISAFKKFAPKHRTRVAESLGEAETIAGEIQPQLFVLDFDPPHTNAVEFLNRMSTAHPDARVLVITSGTSPEFSAQRSGRNAVHFVEKPFELANLGAAVQALLGPWAEAGFGDSRGTLRDLNLRDLVPIECVSGATTVLAVTATGEKTGEIHFSDGHISHATAPGLNGVEALHEIMRWENARGSEANRPVSALHTIRGPWSHVFREALRATQPQKGLEESTTTSQAVRSFDEETSAKLGKKIVVIDDTEMLSIFVQDVLSIADPSFQITTALTGREGIQQVQTVLPDLVLLDYSLADLRGDQICEALLKNETTARIPVIMMSGHVPEMMATAERCPNVVGTIAKPFMSEALIQLVNETLAGQGPIVSPSEEVTKAIAIATESPALPPIPETKATRQGNGKKPVKKGAAAKAKDTPEKPTPAAPIKKTSLPKTPPEVRLETPGSPGSASPLTAPKKFPASKHGNVLLGWAMEVISVQFTPRFQLGTIRVRPTAKLSLTQLRLPPVIGNGAGFEVGKAELGEDGRIKTLRLRPTRGPADSIHIRKGFDINDVELVNETACIQFTSGPASPMTLQLLATFELVGVELSDRFEVAQLILRPEGTRVRVSLDPRSREKGGAEFDTVSVQLDSAARIVEFVLNPARA